MHKPDSDVQRELSNLEKRFWKRKSSLARLPENEDNNEEQKELDKAKYRRITQLANIIITSITILSIYILVKILYVFLQN